MVTIFITKMTITWKYTWWNNNFKLYTTVFEGKNYNEIIIKYNLQLENKMMANSRHVTKNRQEITDMKVLMMEQKPFF